MSIDLTKEPGQAKVRDFIKDCAVKNKVIVDEIFFNQNSAMMQTIITIRKRLGPMRDDCYTIRMPVSHEIQYEAQGEFGEAQNDPLSHELETYIRQMKEELTEWYKIAGHDIKCYPYDKGEIQCMRCNEQFEVLGDRNLFQQSLGRLHTKPERYEAFKRYLHGWAYEYPCQEVQERKFMYREGIDATTKAVPH